MGIYIFMKKWKKNETVHTTIVVDIKYLEKKLLDTKYVVEREKREKGKESERKRYLD